MIGLYPLLGLELALVLAIVCWGIGSDYGVPNLFWHETGLMQLLAGCAVALLLGEISFVSFLLSSEASWLREPSQSTAWANRLLAWVVPEPPEGDSSATWRKLHWYLGVTWLVLLFICIIPSVFVIYQSERWQDAPSVYFLSLFGQQVLVFVFLQRYWFVLGFLAALVITSGLVRAFHWLSRNDWMGFTRLARLGDLSDLPPNKQQMHLMAAWSVLVILATYGLLLLASFFPQAHPFVFWLSPAVTICLLLGLATAVYGFIRFHWPAWVIPALLLATAWIIFANLAPPAPFKQRFQEMASSYDHLVDLAEHQKEYQGLLKQYDLQSAEVNARAGIPRLRKWRDLHSDKPILVVVCVSGGASRSALWTVVVLSQLEQKLRWLPGQIHLITGASGGMFGAAYWTATLGSDGQHRDRAGTALDLEALVANLSQDNLTEVGQHFALRDLPMLFVPGLAYQGDRGEALERAWSSTLNGTLDVPVTDLATGEEAGWRPTLIFAPMLVEDGRRLLISNLDLRFLVDTSGSFQDDEAPSAPVSLRRRRVVQRDRKEAKGQTETREYSLSAMEFFSLFPDAKSFRLSTAVRMQASFPYVSPAVALPTHPARHVVDAAYYDNYGVNIAAGWLLHHRPWLERHVRGVLLVQIRDSLSEQHRLSLDLRANEPGWLDRGLLELTGPPTGALTAREAVMSFRNDEQLQELNDLFNRTSADFFTTAVFERPGAAAMSWTMTKADTTRIRGGMANLPNKTSLKHLKKWWDRRAAAHP
jgi:hypothetical protein